MPAPFKWRRGPVEGRVQSWRATTTSAGTQTLSRDRHGRRKHSLALTGSVRYIRLVFGGSSPDDAAAFFEVGAVYVFSTALTLPQNPLLGSDANPSLPQTLASPWVAAQT